MDDNLNWSDAARHTVRDYLAIAFRHRGLLIACSIFVVTVTVLAMLVLPSYEVTSKILVERDREDPVVTAVGDTVAAPQFGSSNIDEAELNAEVDMLTGRDLLRNVATDCKLQNDVWNFFPFTVPMLLYPPPAGLDPRVDMAAKRLYKKLQIQTTAGATVTNSIDISYKNHHPETAYCVLNALNNRYVELHLAVHHPHGELNFFSSQADNYRSSLAKTEQLLANFPKEYGAVSPALEKEIALQRLNEFKASLEQTRANIAQTQERIRYLLAQDAQNPARIVTEQKTGDNAELQQKLRSTLLTLELKRTDLLAKFQPDYRPVQEVEAQIAETRAAIDAAEKAAVKEQTTDLDPAHEWMRSELAKAQTEVKDLQAQADADASIISTYRAQAYRLNTTGLLQQDLLREAKAEEQSYLLYRNKREEARIADALDQARFGNVAVAEQPVLPAIPDHNPLLYGMAAFLACTILSVGMFITVEYVRPSFHTPDELEAMLSLPVLASIPLEYTANGNGHRNGSGANGNGHGAHKSQRSTAIMDL